MKKYIIIAREKIINTDHHFHDDKGLKVLDGYIEYPFETEDDLSNNEVVIRVLKDFELKYPSFRVENLEIKDADTGKIVSKQHID